MESPSIGTKDKTTTRGRVVDRASSSSTTTTRTGGPRGRGRGRGGGGRSSRSASPAGGESYALRVCHLLVAAARWPVVRCPAALAPPPERRRGGGLGCAFLFLFLFSGPSQITGILEGILFVPAKRNSCNYVPVFLECVSQEFLSCRNLGHSCKNQAILTVLPYEGTPTNLAVATQQKAQDTDTR